MDLRVISNHEVAGHDWEVYVPDIHRVRYSEGDKSLSIQIEGGQPQPGLIDWWVYVPPNLRWDPPHQLDEILRAHQETIVVRIQSALHALDMKFTLKSIA